MAENRQLWLLRHGATEWAKNGRHTGSTDLPLLPEGEDEARRLAPTLTSQTFAAVFSSPLQRARRTCELGGLGNRLMVMPELLEWNYGDYEGITTAEIRKTVPSTSCRAPLGGRKLPQATSSPLSGRSRSTRAQEGGSQKTENT